jgi:hypothetical protein
MHMAGDVIQWGWVAMHPMQEVEAPFHEAYYTHTSTSPNYQILASLDVGRRQMELEGFQACACACPRTGLSPLSAPVYLV